MKSRNPAALGGAALALALFAGPASAGDNYVATFTDFTQSQAREGYATLDKLLAGLAFNLGNRASTYNLSLRGVAATLVDSDGPCCVSVDIPALGITNQPLPGQTYEENMHQLRKLLTQGDVSRRLSLESARSSPTDPVAGNPASQMARMVAFDFAAAFFPFASNLADGEEKVAQAGGLPAGAVRGPMRNLPGVGMQLGLLKDGDQSVKVLTLPFSYSVRSDLDPRRQFNVYLPLTVADIDGARVQQGTLGGSVRLPLATNWALTTAMNYSILDAKDLGTAGKIGSLSITSSYVIRGDSGSLGIGNMVGHYRALSGTVGGIDTGTGISNTVFRNGLLWSMPASFLGFGNSIEYTLINTHYTGTELYLKNYSEIGISAGTNRRADSNRSYMQGGLSYLFSSKTKGVLASFGYWF